MGKPPVCPRTSTTTPQKNSRPLKKKSAGKTRGLKINVFYQELTVSVKFHSELFESRAGEAAYDKV